MILLNSYRLKYLFSQCGNKNRIHPFSKFINKKNISIGDKNYFAENSKVLSATKNTYIEIGDCNRFEYNSTVNSHEGYVIIGDNNFIGNNSILQGFGGLMIGNNCMIAGNSFISSSNHDFSNPESDNYLKNEIGNKVIIEDKVWIGANCVVTAGIRIGKCAIIGAGSVVTKNVKPYTLVAGSPAKEIKHFDFISSTWRSST